MQASEVLPGAEKNCGLFPEWGQPSRSLPAGAAHTHTHTRHVEGGQLRARGSAGSGCPAPEPGASVATVAGEVAAGCR